MNRQASAENPADHLPYEHLPTVSSGEPFGLLTGIRVVDLTTSIAGPYATMLLSDFGAEIVKVERPQGDDTRQWGPPFLSGEALWFTAVNRNKKSVVIDIRSEAGYASLIELVRSADVVVTNQPPSVQRKLKLDYDTLKKVREDLVFVAITGFGLDGERADFTCYDLIAEGYSGIMDVTGAAGGEPQKVGTPAADMLAGQDAAMSVMSALYDRAQTGNGHKIDVSLVESMTRFLTCRISPYLGSGDVPRRSGGTDSVIAIYQSFHTADLPLTLGLGSDSIWQRFWAAVGDSEYGARETFRTNADRRRVRPEIVEKIQSLLIQKPRDEWLTIFAEARVPSGPINRIDELTADPELLRRQLFFALTDDSGRIVPQIGLGIRINDRNSLPRSMPPRLGEHSEEILGPLRV